VNDIVHEVQRIFVGGRGVAPSTDRVVEVISPHTEQRIGRVAAAGPEDVGGDGLPEGVDRGWYVRPTLFSEVDNDMRIAREEIVGPVLTVIPCADEDEAGEADADVCAPLSGWTRRRRSAG
jgi:betaine-aldehyde dehydrogenase